MAIEFEKGATGLTGLPDTRGPLDPGPISPDDGEEGPVEDPGGHGLKE